MLAKPYARSVPARRELFRTDDVEVLHNKAQSRCYALLASSLWYTGVSMTATDGPAQYSKAGWAEKR
ncbi:hypothetical protein NBRC116187_09730 [Halopseudomonas sabulinigri]|uniref:Uncharacterized protein n=1 Tax=Halopseudomonas sabulinigri TaxID=472181 RepID=A0ABP9ZME0_9GAMM